MERWVFLQTQRSHLPSRFCPARSLHQLHQNWRLVVLIRRLESQDSNPTPGRNCHFRPICLQKPPFLGQNSLPPLLWAGRPASTNVRIAAAGRCGQRVKKDGMVENIRGKKCCISEPQLLQLHPECCQLIPEHRQPQTSFPESNNNIFQIQRKQREIERNPCKEHG